MTAELDDWLPRPAIRVAHRRASTAPAAELWRAAAQLRLADSPVLGRLVQWRIPGLRRDLRFDQMFREPPFMVLAEHEHVLVTGLVGRIWTLRRDYPRLEGPEEFRKWSRGGTARVAIAMWSEDRDGGGTLAAEARVQAIGIQGQVGIAAVRPLVRGFEQLIGTETLRAAVRRAEQG